jgi:hypothetical protein
MVLRRDRAITGASGNQDAICQITFWLMQIMNERTHTCPFRGPPSLSLVYIGRNAQREEKIELIHIRYT